MTSKNFVSGLILIGGTILLAGCGISGLVSTPPVGGQILGQHHTVPTQQPTPSLTAPSMPKSVASLSALPYHAHLYYSLQYFTGSPRTGFYFEILESPHTKIAIGGASPGGNAAPLGWLVTGPTGWLVPPYHAGYAFGLQDGILTQDTTQTIELNLGSHASYWIWSKDPNRHNTLIASGNLKQGFLVVPHMPAHLLQIQYRNQDGVPAKDNTFHTLWVYEPAHIIRIQ